MEHESWRVARFADNKELYAIYSPLCWSIAKCNHTSVVLPVYYVNDVDIELFFVHELVYVEQRLRHGSCAVLACPKLICKPVFVVEIQSFQFRLQRRREKCFLAGWFLLQWSACQSKNHACSLVHFLSEPVPFGGSTVLTLTRGPAGTRTTTSSLSPWTSGEPNHYQQFLTAPRGRLLQSHNKINSLDLGSMRRLAQRGTLSWVVES